MSGSDPFQTRPLERALRSLGHAFRRGRARAQSRAERRPLAISPVSAFDVVLQERMNALERSVEELKGRVNGLIFLVLGAVLTQLLLGILK